MSFKKTLKQIEAVKLMGGIAKYILLLGGSRSGKTFIIIRQIILRALKEPNSRHLVVRFAFNHAKQSLWYDTIPKCFELCFPGVKERCILNKSDWFIEFPNGSQIWLGGLDDKERTEKVLGNEYSTIFFNEVSQMSWSSVVMTLTRLAQKTGLVNKAFYDCNPPSKKHWSYKLWVEHIEPQSNESIAPELHQYYAHMRLNPDDNKENLPIDYIPSVLGTLSSRMQKRFRYGEFMDDVEGALWNWDMIDRWRLNDIPELVRIVVAIDPSGRGKKDKADDPDEAGIVVVGIDRDNFVYVLEDASGIMSPNQWGTVGVRMYYKWRADRIVAEVNQGWDMVEAIIKSIDNLVPVKKVTATRGKTLRAEPVVALYEQGRVHHIGTHNKLEEEMTTWDSRESLKSPGRIDALVHGVTELAIKDKGEFVLV